MEKRAIILAGGRGTRLRPFTVALPKPLVPVGDKPILEIIVHQLVSHGFEHLTFAVNHQADIIRAYFGAGEKYHANIDYSLERQPLSTMGPLRLIRNLPDNFLDWALTAVTHGTPDFWTGLMKEAGYTGDYYWTILDINPDWIVS